MRQVPFGPAYARLLIGAFGLALVVAGGFIGAQEQAPTATAQDTASGADAGGTLIFGQDGKPSPVSDPKAIAVIDRYLTAIGGRPVLDKIADRKVSYTNTIFQPTSEARADITLMIKGDYNLREEWELNYEIKEGQKLAFVQVYSDETEEGWVQVMGRVDRLDGNTLLVFVHGKYMDDFFCHWADDGYVATLGGEAEIDTGEEIESADIVKIVDFSGRQIERYFFSRETGLLLKKEWRDTTRNPSKPIKREQYFKRYKKIPFMDDSGLAINFSMLQEIYGDGDLDTERRYRSVQFNAGLEDELFERPEGLPGPKVESPGPGQKPVLIDPGKLLEQKPVEDDAPKKTEGSATRRRPGS